VRTVRASDGRFDRLSPVIVPYCGHVDGAFYASFTGCKLGTVLGKPVKLTLVN